jgi:1-aminocyclopropane-1-carboxylate deaminase/D-cysteine desulfhydrase-like pyridoxal-dependent ACC family enzyme
MCGCQKSVSPYIRCRVHLTIINEVSMSQEQEQTLTAAIADLPRVRLGVHPTPLEYLPRLSEALGGPPIYVKRDDLTGLAFGGNKTRMLEFSLADAQANGAEVIVFGAAVQSNYCRQLAAGCAKLGIELHLVLRPEREIDKTDIQGNNLLQRLFGAKVTVLDSNDRPAQQVAIAKYADQLRAAGRRVYVPRQPETVDLDVIAYAESALEIVQQCRDAGIAPAYLYTTAYDTTQAGLVLGMKYLESGVTVRGFTPIGGDDEQRVQRMVEMSNQAAERLGLPLEVSAADFRSDAGYVGERYGIPTSEGLAALQLLARTEGILLDPVYTSKGMAALIGDIRSGKLAVDQPVVFLHTGGAPALFGYAEELAAEGLLT